MLMKNPDTILAMQSVMGNQAVQRALKANEQAEKEKKEELIKKIQAKNFTPLINPHYL